MNTLTLFFFMIATVLLTACIDNEKKSDSVVDKGVWIQDELFTQINSLRKEIVELKAQLNSVDKKLTEHLNGKKQAEIKSLSLQAIESIGSGSAKFAIIEFSDFQCPYCSRHDKKVFPKIQKQYIETGKFRYMARDFPLAFHSQAPAAAKAAHCAGDQDQYWPMRHKLFAGGSLNSDRFTQDALALDLDMDDFNECMQTNKYAQRVQNDLAYGDKAGVDGTPRFYIGRIQDDQLIDVIPLSGAQPFSAFERVIKQVMNKKS